MHGLSIAEIRVSNHKISTSAKTMTQLIFAALSFIALHVGVAGTSVRDRAIEKLGENMYRAIFSLLSLAGIFWLSHAYRAAGYIETWGQLAWFKPVVAILMLIAFFFTVLGMLTPNPTAVGGEKLLMADLPAWDSSRNPPSIPMGGIVGICPYAHMLANGDVASFLLFGSLLVMVLAGMASIDNKRKKACGRHWDRYASATSILPFRAIKDGRNRLVITEFKNWQVVLALVLYLFVMYFHQAWFGVYPLF